MNEVDQKYTAARELLERNRARDAIQALIAITEEHPDYVPAQNDLGVLLVHAAEFDRAVPYLSKVWDLTLGAEQANNLAYAFRAGGKKDLAISALMQADHMSKLNTAGSKMLSELLYETGNLMALVQCLESWNKREPENFDVILRMLELPAMATHSLQNDLTHSRPVVEDFITAMMGDKTPLPRIRPSDPRITIGIPTRNRRGPLYVTLSSIARQTYRNFEVLISDDSEEPGLEQELARIFPDLRIRYVRGPQVSLPANRAHIFLHSTGEYVVMCDDDHYMLPDCLELLVDTMRANPDSAIVSAVWPHPLEHPKTIRFEERKNESDYRLDIQNVGAPEDFWWKNGCEAFKAYCLDWPLLESELAGGGCLLYRRSAVMSVGGFPRECSFVSFREDTDMSHRLYLAGYRILIQTGALAYHMRAADGGCRDGKSWGERLVRDGLGFLERLKVWRSEAKERSELKAAGPVKIRLQLTDPALSSYWTDLLHLAADEVQLVDAEGSDVLVITDLAGATRKTTASQIVTVLTKEQEKEALSLIAARQALGAVTPILSIAEEHIEEREWSYLPPVATGEHTLTVCSFVETERELSIIEEVCKEFGLGLRVVLLPEARAAGEESTREACKELFESCDVFISFSAPTYIGPALTAGLQVITSAAFGRAFDSAELRIAEPTEASLRLAVHDLIEKSLEREGALSNAPSPEGAKATVIAVLRELQRRGRFGCRQRANVDERMVRKLVDENFSDKPKRPVSSYIVRTEGKIVELAPDFIPRDHTGFEQLIKQLNSLPPFHFHYGGAGDGLLLLSTFYDIRPGATVLCCATAPRAMEAFFREFPGLEKVYLVELPNDGVRQTVLRAAMSATTQCVGRGATPLRSHEEEWVEGLDVTNAYGIQLYPTWIKSFAPLQAAPRQVTVGPRGSCLHMTSGKQNTLPPHLWPELIRTVLAAGYTPVIIGTPDEREEYPELSGCMDKRSYSFGEQMRLINGSEIFIGADSWAKTFSAMGGKPTIVFRPTVDGEFTSFTDVSVNAFIRPWPNIAFIGGIGELSLILGRGLKGSAFPLAQHSAS